MASGKVPAYGQLCCRHLRPNPYDDSHCVAAHVRYDTRLSSSSICSEDKEGLIKQALAACSCRLQLLVSYLWSSAAVSVCGFRSQIALYELTRGSRPVELQAILVSLFLRDGGPEAEKTLRPWAVVVRMLRTCQESTLVQAAF